MVSSVDVDKLLAIRSDEIPVLSLYVEVPFDQNDLRELQAKASELIAAAAGGPGAAAGPAGARALASARQDVGRLLAAGARNWLGHCVGIFVCAPVGLAETMVLPAGAGERAVLAPRPYIRPLLVAVQRHPAYLVVVVNRRHAWLFSVTDAQIELMAHPTAPGVQSASYGGWYGLESYRVNERVAELAHQHFEDTARMLADAVGRVPGEMFVAGGHAATIPQFLATLGQDTRNRFAGSFMVDTAAMTPAKVRALADPLIAAAVHRQEEDLVSRIRQQPPAGLAVGMPECLAAIRQHAIGTLAVPVQTLVPGLTCQACGALGRTRAELQAWQAGCAHPDSEISAVPDLVEELAVAAIEDGGQVEAVADPPGGIAALLRFPLPARLSRGDLDLDGNGRGGFADHGRCR